MDSGSCASSVKHDPVEDPAHITRGRRSRHRPVNLSVSAVRLGRRVHDLGHRVESLWYGRESSRGRVEDLGDPRVCGHAGLRGYVRHPVGDLGQEVLRVGVRVWIGVLVLPVAVEVRDVAVVPVVGGLGWETPGQETHGQSEKEVRRGHGFTAGDGEEAAGGCWRREGARKQWRWREAERTLRTVRSSLYCI